MNPPLRCALLYSFALLLMANDVRSDDWNQWGGPQRDVVWRETGIIKKFSTTKLLPRVWSTPIKEGYAGPAVADGRVFITDFDRQQETKGKERVLCLDAKDGKILWKHELKMIYKINYPAGPRTTPVVDGNRVYTIGAMGNMFCFDVKNGDVIWKKDFVKDYRTRIPIWGDGCFPVG